MNDISERRREFIDPSDCSGTEEERMAFKVSRDEIRAWLETEFTTTSHNSEIMEGE